MATHIHIFIEQLHKAAPLLPFLIFGFGAGVIQAKYIAPTIKKAHSTRAKAIVFAKFMLTSVAAVLAGIGCAYLLQ